MKTQEELKAIKEEYETMNKKLAELNEEELEQVAGGRIVSSERYEYFCPNCNRTFIYYRTPEYCHYCGISHNEVRFEMVGVVQ